MISALRRVPIAPRAGILLLAGSTYGTLALGLVTGPLLARALGPAGRGDIASVTVYVALANALLGLGISTAVLHAVRQKSNSEEQILDAVLRFTLWLVPPSICNAAVVSQLVLVHLKGPAKLWCFISLATVPLNVLGLSLTSFVIARASLTWIAGLRLVSTGSVAVFVVIFAVIGDLTVSGYLALSLGASILTALLTFQAVGIRPRRGARLRPLLAFGRRAWVGSVANMANVGLDQALIAPFLGAADLGHYAIAVTLSLLPFGLSSAIGQRIWGDVTIGTEEDVDPRRVGEYVRIVVAAATWVALGLGIVVPLSLPLLYGTAFDASVLPLILLLPGAVAYSGGWVLEAALVMSGRPGVNSKAELAAVVWTVVGLAATLPVIGIVGAAITTSLAYSVRFRVQLRALRQLGVVDWRPHATDMGRIVREAVGLLGRIVRARGTMGG